MFFIIRELYDGSRVEAPEFIATFDTFEESLECVISEYIIENLSDNHLLDERKLREEAIRIWNERKDVYYGSFYWYIFDSNKTTGERWFKNPETKPCTTCTRCSDLQYKKA